MRFLAIYAGLPLLAYLALCALPRGRPALAGLGAGLAGALWLHLHYGRVGDPWGRMLALAFMGGVLLAGVAQALRRWLPGWRYRTVAAGLPGLLALVLFGIVEV